MSQAHAADEILLRVPARAAYARVVRDGIAALADRRGFSESQIDDLGTAVEEAVALLMAADGQERTDEEAAVECVFRLKDGGLEIEAIRSDRSPLPPGASDRFSRQAAQLVDECDLDEAAARIRLRKLSRPTT